MCSRIHLKHHRAASQSTINPNTAWAPYEYQSMLGGAVAGMGIPRNGIGTSSRPVRSLQLGQRQTTTQDDTLARREQPGLLIRADSLFAWLLLLREEIDVGLRADSLRAPSYAERAPGASRALTCITTRPSHPIAFLPCSPTRFV